MDIKQLIDDTPSGGTAYIPEGEHILPELLSLPKSITIIGAGMGKTILKTTVTDTNGIWINKDYVKLKGFTIDGASQIDGVASLINIHDCDYLSLEDIEVKNAGTVGINLYGVSNSSLQNVHAHDNYSHGVHPGAFGLVGRNIGNTYRDIYCWNNGSNGFDDWGNNINVDQHNVYDNLQCYDNAIYGIAICNQKNSILSNSLASGNGSRGIYSEYIADFTIENLTLNNNSVSATKIKYSNNLNLINVTAKNNGTGIDIRDCNNIVFTSCQSYDDREIPLQKYGLELNNTNAGITLIGCKLLPNKLGDIYNPKNIEIIIKEGNIMPSQEIIMDGDKMCIAWFKKKQFTLTTKCEPAEGGTITPVTGKFNKNAIINVEATPNEDYEFDHWEVI